MAKKAKTATKAATTKKTAAPAPKAPAKKRVTFMSGVNKAAIATFIGTVGWVVYIH